MRKAWKDIVAVLLMATAIWLIGFRGEASQAYMDVGEWPGGVMTRVGGCFEKMTYGPEKGEYYSCRISVFATSIRSDPGSGKIRALYFIEDLNYHFKDFDGRRDWLLWITLDPTTGTYKVERSYAAFPHSDGPWFSDWKPQHWPGQVPLPKSAWVKSFKGVKELYRVMVTKNYATLRDFEDNVIQQSPYTF